MDSYVQHRYALRNDDHTDDVEAPGNGGDGAGEDEVIECDINKDLATVQDSNHGDFVFGNDAYEDPENGAIEWSCKHDFSILEDQFEGLSADPKVVSEIYQDILNTDVYRKICQEILDDNLGYFQRLAHD